MPPGKPEGASCVQEFDDSLNSAIRITYRISLRSSSLREPRYPLLRVVHNFVCFSTTFAEEKGSDKEKKGFGLKFEWRGEKLSIQEEQPG